jgi:hypothetical protein
MNAAPTHSWKRLGITVVVLLVLGIAAYGFGFSVSQQRLPSQTFVPVRNGSTAPSVVAAVCNIAPSADGGGGRCYQGCSTDTDCAAVSSAEACVAFAATLCNGSATCIAQLCGPATPLCFQGFCTRPQFRLTQDECVHPTATSTPVAGKWIGLCPGKEPSPAASLVNCTEQDVSLCNVRGESATDVNANTTETAPATCLFQPGHCFQSCDTDTDCPAPTAANCTAQAKAQCSHPTVVLDQNCNVQAFALCMRPSVCAHGRCSLAIPATSAAECTASTSSSYGTSWTGFCSNNPTTECLTAADCSSAGSQQ